MPVDVALLTAALLAGAATFFSPCSVALIPAYAGFFLGLNEQRPEPAWRAAQEGARFGAAAAGGILAMFALGGVLLYVLRAVLGWALVGLGDFISVLGLIAGLAVVALGVLYLVDRGPRALSPLQAPRRRTVGGMASFGVVFALASMGCSLPVWFAVIVQGLAQGPLGALLTVLAFGVGLAGLLALTAVLLSIAHDETRRRLKAIRRWARPIGGIVLILAGSYMIGYYVTAVGVL